MSVLQRIQAWAPVPVYLAIGEDGVGAAEAARVNPALTIAASVRHASILLVCGAIRDNDRPALARLHDQLPHPRAVLWWSAAPLVEAADSVCLIDDDVTPALLRLDRQLRSGDRASDVDWLPDEPPNPWEGKGDYGQGGEGMMGGVPFGRSMPMTDEDLRDGLTLDAMTIRIGPWAAMLPPGLSLELTLQGDTVQQVKVLEQAYATEAPYETTSRWQAARLLALLGLDVLAHRCRQGSGEGALPRDRLRSARRCGAIFAIPPDLGRIGGSTVRSRLEAMLCGAPLALPHDAPLLVDLLAGCEWQEAMLLINSIPLEDLPRLTSLAVAKGADKEAPPQTAHQHHGGHD